MATPLSTNSTNLTIALAVSRPQEESRPFHRKVCDQLFQSYIPTDEFVAHPHIGPELALWKARAILAFRDYYRISNTDSRKEDGRVFEEIRAIAKEFLESEFYEEIREVIGLPEFQPDFEIDPAMRMLFKKMHRGTHYGQRAKNDRKA